jgi:hypothetical protein
MAWRYRRYVYMLVLSCLCVACGAPLVYDPAALPEQVAFDIGRGKVAFHAVGESPHGSAGIRLELPYSMRLLDSAAYAVGCQFYVVFLGPEGDTVFHPRRLSPSIEYETKAVNYSFFDNWNNPNPLDFFVPMRHFDLPAGEHRLTYLLMVTDDSLKARFPPLQRGNLLVKQPKRWTYELDFQHAEANNKVAADGLSKEDLHWRLMVGADVVYQSPVANNADSILPAKVRFHLCDGESVDLDIMEKDLINVHLGGIQLGTIDFDLRGGPSVTVMDSTLSSVHHVRLTLRPLRDEASPSAQK